MKLPKGISGFTRLKAQYPEELLAEVGKALTEISHCKLLNIYPIGLSNNYHEFEIKYFNPLKQFEAAHYSILINGIYNYWAMIDKEKSSWMQLVFIEPPSIFKDRLNKDWQEIELSILKTLIEPAHLTELDKSEKKQIKYWATKTLGEVIFNGYD